MELWVVIRGFINLYFLCVVPKPWPRGPCRDRAQNWVIQDLSLTLPSDSEVSLPPPSRLAGHTAGAGVAADPTGTPSWPYRHC